MPRSAARQLRRGFTLIELIAGPESAGVVRNGRFEIPAEEGPMIGTLRVEIRAEQDPGFPLDDPQAFAQQGVKALPPNRIPPKYNDHSELTVTTTADGPNEFTCRLETGP